MFQVLSLLSQRSQKSRLQSKRLTLQSAVPAIHVMVWVDNDLFDNIDVWIRRLLTWKLVSLDVHSQNGVRSSLEQFPSLTSHRRNSDTFLVVPIPLGLSFELNRSVSEFLADYLTLPIFIMFFLYWYVWVCCSVVKGSHED